MGEIEMEIARAADKIADSLEFGFKEIDKEGAGGMGALEGIASEIGRMADAITYLAEVYEKYYKTI